MGLRHGVQKKRQCLTLISKQNVYLILFNAIINIVISKLVLIFSQAVSIYRLQISFLKKINKYLLLTKFDGHTVSYGPKGSRPRSQVIRTLDYRPLNQPITVHLICERYNNYHNTYSRYKTVIKINVVDHRKVK